MSAHCSTLSLICTYMYTHVYIHVYVHVHMYIFVCCVHVTVNVIYNIVYCRHADTLVQLDNGVKIPPRLDSVYCTKSVELHSFIVAGNVRSVISPITFGSI